MKRFFLFLFSFLFFLVTYAKSPADSLMEELDRTIEKRDEYLKKKHKRITLIQKQEFSASGFSESTEKNALLFKYSIADQLFEEYKSFIYDSAFHYARILLQTAYELKQDSLINTAKIKTSFTLLSAGMFKEALDTLNSVEANALKKDLKIEYYSILARTYYDMANYSNDNYFSERYDKKGNAYLQQAIELCEPNSIPYLLQKGLWYMRVHDTLKAISTFEQVLKNPKLSMHEMAIAASSVSYMYQITYNREKAKEYLAKAAIADITSCVRETVATLDLAELLYREGKAERDPIKIGRSYKYIKIASDDASFYGAKHRKIQIANILPRIEEIHLNIVEGRKDNVFYYYIIGGLLILFIILFVIILLRQKRK